MGYDQIRWPDTLFCQHDYPTAMSKPPPQPTKENSAKLRKELWVFFLFLGLMLAAAGYLLLVSDTLGRRQIWGFTQNVTLGAPTLVIGLSFGLAGVLLLCGAFRPSVIVGCIASAAFALFYVAIMAVLTGTLPFSLITILVFLVPGLVIYRSLLFLRLQRSEAQEH
jgi:hypothetical protein